jgi:hypothetical protein
MQHCRAATGHPNGEPTWLKLAQGLLLSPPSLYGDRSTIGHDHEGERANPAFVLSLGVWVCHSVLSRLLLWFISRLGRKACRSPLELRRRPAYVLVLKLVSLGDFEFSLDISSFGIPARLSSECFVAHQWSDVGVEEREGDCLLLVI